ncbi:unnamed protein product [Schistosoma margrebowiei]|uniref:Uncharacterized protein n=1 Tax=Schistosoma margrebowiei TaxID=48269 RepID=A0AA85AIM2_9TREM|nr:unnamed protein product [Schistosoma margrebowiei]
MLMICRIFLLNFIIELISSQPDTVYLRDGTKDVSIHPETNIMSLSPTKLLIQSLDEVKLMRSMVDNLITKLNNISPSNSANKPLHNGLLSNLCIIFYIIVTFILIFRKY